MELKQNAGSQSASSWDGGNTHFEAFNSNPISIPLFQCQVSGEFSSQ
jgi:hypothetical protein